MLLTKRMIRIVLAVLAASVVFYTGVSCTKRPAIKLTIGELASKDKDYTGEHLVITHATRGERHGKYLVFPSDLPSRRHVVLVVGKVESDGFSSFSGFCSGVRVSVLPGCPCPPPFVFVESASSVSSSTD